MAKFFSIPFAETGDKISPPNPTQADGTVSYAQGFGFDYQRKTDGTDPLAKVFPREQFNGIVNDITGAVGEIQLNGLAAWQDLSPKTPYPVGAMVRHTNKNWVSLVANNTATPVEGASWAEISANGYTKVQIDAKLLLKADKSTTLAGYGISDAYTKAESDSRYAQRSNNLSDLANVVTARSNLGLGTASTANVTTSPADTTAGRVLRVGDFGLGGQLAIDSASLDLESFTRFRGYGVATPGAPTNNGGAAIVICRGSAATLIAVDYTTGDFYYRPIGAAQGWRRFFHSGNVSNYIQTLLVAPDAASARTTLGVVDGVGQGQAWVNLTASRSPNVTYTNNTGRTIGVLVTSSTGSTTNYSVNGMVIATSTIVNGGKPNTFFLVPPGATYGTGAADIERWMELRA